MDKNYSSIYSIKDFASKQLIPKYFSDDVSKLNIGLLGYTTELISNVTEDSFNMVSSFIKEMFPNKATLPESIYTYAALNNIEDFFSIPSCMGLMLFINEDDILNLGENKGSYREFILDSDLIVDIEGKQFMIDYDIIIQAKPYKNDFIFSAFYNIDFTNSISEVKNPYIKLKRINYSNGKYLGLLVKARQINKFSLTQNIINNDRINLPTITVDFTNQLANFEVFYKAPGNVKYTQLVKKSLNSSPLKVPFCFYRFKNNSQIEITFTSRDNYFQPAFNSEILINFYTTTGEIGNFPLYKGDNITVLPKSDIYEYNNKIIVFAIAQTESTGGKNSLSVEQIKELVLERHSTSGAFNTESDLQTYFSKFSDNNGTEILFIKKRDDLFQRLFSAFSLIKDSYDNIFHTNTLNLNIYPSSFDLEYEQSDRYILKAGHLFKYSESSIDNCEIIPEISLKDNFDHLTDDFIYTNPFLMTVGKNPNVVGFYLNSIDKRFVLDYTFVNTDSVIQFICNSVLITRNALKDETDYTLSINIMPTTELDQNVIDKTTGMDLGIIKIACVIQDETNSEIGYTDFTLKSYDSNTNIFTFETKITTDDYMSLNRMRVSNIKNLESQLTETKLIPMIDCNINISIFYKYSDNKIPHKYDHNPEFQQYSLTNTYSNIDEKITFIDPINVIRSDLKYIEVDPSTYFMNMTAIPFVKAKTMKDPNLYSQFLRSLFNQYQYIQDILNQVTNNYGITMKFYNTYGKSKNFIAGENDTLLNKVNVKIKLKVKFVDTVIDVEGAIRDIKIFIKGYIENINDNGSNAIYISNLIKSLENTFPTINFLIFNQLNDYDPSVQILKNKTTDVLLMTKEERINYIPEYLTISDEDIIIDLI